jgi:hypothetical protein
MAKPKTAKPKVAKPAHAPAIVNLPIPLDGERRRELIADCARFAEGTLTEAQVRKKYRFNENAWEALGADDALVEAIEAEKLRRIRDGSAKREKAQLLVVKGPAILDSIASDASASPRHRVDAIKTLDGMAAGGPAEAATQDRFIITINLGTDSSGRPVVEHFDKPFAAIDVSPNKREEIEW